MPAQPYCTWSEDKSGNENRPIVIWAGSEQDREYGQESGAGTLPDILGWLATIGSLLNL